jgi:hypothetical protein
MVTISPYAASVEDVKDEEEEKARSRSKLVANGCYVLMSESEIRSERGERDQKIARDVPKEYTRTLNDYPKDPLSGTPLFSYKVRVRPLIR